MQRSRIADADQPCSKSSAAFVKSPRRHAVVTPMVSADDSNRRLPGTTRAGRFLGARRRTGLWSSARGFLARSRAAHIRRPTLRRAAGRAVQSRAFARRPGSRSRWHVAPVHDSGPSPAPGSSFLVVTLPSTRRPE